MDYLPTVNQIDIKKILSITASISTILQFLAGTLVCLKIVQKKSTGDISSFPLVCGFLSTSLWLRYGFLIQDHSLILVNTVGATLHLAYVFTFYIYSIKKSVVLRQIISSVLVIMLVFGYSQFEQNKALLTKYTGLLCCMMTIMFFAAPLASLFHVVKVKNAESLPFPIIFMTFIVSTQWFFYGILLSDRYIQVPNLLGCALSAFQLSLFWIYPGNIAKPQYTTLHDL